jgi:hypothetical protein
MVAPVIVGLVSVPTFCIVLVPVEMSSPCRTTGRTASTVSPALTPSVVYVSRLAM